MQPTIMADYSQVSDSENPDGGHVFKKEDMSSFCRTSGNPMNTADWSTIQHSVAVVQTRQYQAAGQSSGEFCGQQVTNNALDNSHSSQKSLHNNKTVTKTASKPRFEHRGR